MSAAHDLAYEDWCDRLEPREPEDYDEHAYWASLMDAAEKQTGEHMAQALGTDTELIDETSGVFASPEILGLVEVTDDSIRVPPTGGADEAKLKAEAVDAIGFLSTETRYALTCDMLAALEPDRAAAAMAERACRLPAEHQATLARELLQLLTNASELAKAKADLARDQQRACEVAILDAIKPAKHLMGGA